MNHYGPMRWFGRAIAACGLLSIVFAISCGKSDGLLKHGTGLYIDSSADLKPDVDPGPQKVIYAGTVIPCDVKTSNKNGEYSIDLWYNGVLLEQEKYRSLPAEFDLENAAGEDYSPPIPLLRFPMHIGDAWKWSGQMLTGPTGRKADATVSTREGSVDMGSPVDALVVDVDLSIESGASTPASRKLTLYFVKGKGLVQRDFGASTSRVPESSKSVQ